MPIPIFKEKQEHIFSSVCYEFCKFNIDNTLDLYKIVNEAMPANIMQWERELANNFFFFFFFMIYTLKFCKKFLVYL